MNNGDFDYYNKQTDGQEGRYQRPHSASEDISGVVDSLSRPRTMLYSVLSLACGIGALFLAAFGGWFGLFIGALAIVFSIAYATMKNKKEAIAFVMASFSIICGLRFLC